MWPRNNHPLLYCCSRPRATVETSVYHGSNRCPPPPPTAARSNQLKLLSGATSGDPNPIPGYMYDEITKITFISVSTCAELEDDLLSRLKKKSPHTKAKVGCAVRLPRRTRGGGGGVERKNTPKRDCKRLRGKLWGSCGGCVNLDGMGVLRSVHQRVRP